MLVGDSIPNSPLVLRNTWKSLCLARGHLDSAFLFLFFFFFNKYLYIFYSGLWPWVSQQPHFERFVCFESLLTGVQLPPVSSCLIRDSRSVLWDAEVLKSWNCFLVSLREQPLVHSLVWYVQRPSVSAKRFMWSFFDVHVPTSWSPMAMLC